MRPTVEGRTLNVIAFKEGMADSEVHSATYYYEYEPGDPTNAALAPATLASAASSTLAASTNTSSSPGYDLNGNLTHYKGWVYTYDAQNRLRTARHNGTLVATYYYDGKNRQIARSINNLIRFSVWDGWELIEEYGSDRATAYLQGATGVIKSWGNDGTYYYYQDKLGSTTHTADGSGALVESFRYDLYGKPDQPSAHGVVDLYAGERWVGELGLYDLRNRFLSSELGRFLQADPIGFKGDASNLYRYCHNDPENFTDPMGLIAVDDRWSRLMHWQGNSPYSYNQIAEAYRNLQPAGMNGGDRGGDRGATVTGQHHRSGPQEPVGRGSRSPTEADEPLRMLPPKDATTEGWERYAYLQLANKDAIPLSGGNFKFQEVTTKGPNNTFRTTTTDKKPPHELIRGGLFKDHIGFSLEHRPRSDDPRGNTILYQSFKSYYPDGRPGPIISTRLQHVTRFPANGPVTNSIYVIVP